MGCGPSQPYVPRQLYPPGYEINVFADQFRTFCYPTEMVLTLRENAFSFSGDDFHVTTYDGMPMFMMDGQSMSMREEKVLRDVQGMPLLVMRKKLMAFTPTWHLYAGPNMFYRRVTIRRAPGMFSTNVNIYLLPEPFPSPDDDTMVDHLPPTLVFQGDWMAKEITVYWGDPSAGHVVAEISRQFAFSMWNSSETYALRAAPGIDIALLVSAVVGVDEMFNEGSGDDGFMPF